jgi:CSLREA domain-containing protein
MRYLRFLPALLPLLALTACAEDQSPTGPSEQPDASVSAGHQTVNSLADPGDGTCNVRQCTLREAIRDPGSTDISFAPGLTGPVTLVRSLIIDKSIRITGPAAGVVIRRQATGLTFRVMRIGPGATVALANLTIRDGMTEYPGGGIYNLGALVLRNCRIIANSPSGVANRGSLEVVNSTVANNSGAGIGNYNNSTVTITGSTISRNGGGVSNPGGTLAIDHTVISDNRGGGLYQDRGTSTLDRVRIVRNGTGTGFGGGIYLLNSYITLTNSTVARNSAAEGGGIYNALKGHLTITNSTVAYNTATGRGGGIRSKAGVRGSAFVWLTNSTVSGNTASLGGGMYSEYAPLAGVDLYVVNSTVALNSATQAGGGLAQTAGEEGGVNLTMRNSIVARNSAPVDPDMAQNDLTWVTATYSLIGDGTGGQITNVDGNQVGNRTPYTSPIDPRLGPLADNGGPTQTHALLSDSPAIDAASSADCPATDQRGVTRPQGAGCDIGSYERE